MSTETFVKETETEKSPRSDSRVDGGPTVRVNVETDTTLHPSRFVRKVGGGEDNFSTSVSILERLRRRSVRRKGPNLE